MRLRPPRIRAATSSSPSKAITCRSSDRRVKRPLQETRAGQKSGPGTYRRSRRRADHLGNDIACRPRATAKIAGVRHLYRPAVRDSANSGWLTVHHNGAGLSEPAYIIAAASCPLTRQTLHSGRPAGSDSHGSRCRLADYHVCCAVRTVRTVRAVRAVSPGVALVALV